MRSTYWLPAILCATGLTLPPATYGAKADGEKAKLIAVHDTNGNGSIDGEETEALRKAFADDRTGPLARFDYDRNGNLSDLEIQTIKPGADEATVIKARLIGKYDKNRDGKIDGKETSALRADFKTAEKGPLRRLDRDGNGELSDEELKGIVAAAGAPAKTSEGEKAEAKGSDE